MKTTTSKRFSLAMTLMRDLYLSIDKANIINTETPQDLRNIINYSYSYERMAKAAMANDNETALRYLKRAYKLGLALNKRLKAGSVEILYFGFEG